MDENSRDSSVSPTQSQSAPQELQKDGNEKSVDKKNFLIALASAGLIIVFAGIVIFLQLQSVGKKSSYEGNAFNRYSEGNYEKSEEIANEGLSKYPDDSYLLKTAINARSNIGNSTGKEKEALDINKKNIDKAMTKTNDDALLIAVGFAYETAEKYETALSYYEKAIAVNPKSADAYFHKGHVLAFLNHIPESKEAYNKAYLLDPTHPQLLIVKGQEFEDNRQPDKAIETYVNVAKNNNASGPVRAEALSSIAMIEIGRGKKTEALQFAKNAYEMDKKSATSTGLYGFLLTYTTDTYKDGINLMTKATKLNPRVSMNYLLLGVSLRANHDYKSAIALQKEALYRVDYDNTLVGQELKKSKKAQIYYELAQSYSLTNDADNTIANLRLAYQANPNYISLVKKNLETGYFKFLQKDPKFLAFLKS